MKLWIDKNKSPTLKQLHYFSAVAEHLSYRGAAHALGVSQPTLTNQINSLEQTLGVPLFERSRSGTSLSVQGRELISQAEEVLQAFQRFHETARELGDGPQMTYKLGIPPTLGPYLLPHLLPELRERYPSLKFYVREGPPKMLSQGLLDGNYDLILSPASLLPNQLTAEKLFVEPLKFVIPNDHPSAGQDYIQPEQMRGEKVLTLEDTHHLHYKVHETCQKLGATLHRDYEGTSLDTLRQMVVMGMGVAFLPGLYVHSELRQRDALHVCELANMPLERQHSLVWRNTSPARVFFRELAGQIRTIMQDRLPGIIMVQG